MSFPIGKRPKLDESSSSSIIISNLSCGWNRIGYEVRCNIYSFLSETRERLNIDQISQTSLREMQNYWKSLGRKEHAFSWREAENKKNSAKWDYLLSSAVVDIALKMAVASNDNYIEIAPPLIGKYLFLAKHFASFQFYTALYLFNYNHISGILHKTWTEISTKSSQENAASDILLYVLNEIKNISTISNELLPEFEKRINKVINNGATCISLLIAAKKPGLLPNIIFERIVLASFDKGDYRALEPLARFYSLEDLQRLYSRYPDVSASILANAAHVKLELRKNEESESLYTQALSKYGDTAPAVVLANAARIKTRLEKYEESESLYNQALSKYGDTAPVTVLENAAQIKLRLNKNEEADSLCTQALLKYRDKLPALAYAARAKLELGKYKEADDFYTKVLTKCGDTVPAKILAEAALVKSKLGKDEDANSLYTQAITKYGDAVPTVVLENATQVKLRLSQSSK